MKRLVFCHVFVLICINSFCQTSFFPDASRNPAWYVLEQSLVSCDGNGCYHVNRVNRYTIQQEPQGAINRYILFSQTVSANTAFNPAQPIAVGYFTEKPNGQTFYKPYDLYPTTVLEDTSGYLMYDASITIGDTTHNGYRWVSVLTGDTFDIEARYVVAQDTISIGGVDRKRWRFGPNYFVNHYAATGNIPLLVNLGVDTALLWVEGIGSNQGIAYGTEVGWLFKQLICYEENGNTLYSFNNELSCDLSLYDLSTSITNLRLDGSLNLHPNPASKVIHFNIDQGTWTYSIFNSLGAKVGDGVTSDYANHIEFNLSNGVYLLVLQEVGVNSYITKRFVVVN
ncbi:hypothetical protein BH09BAC1_BH09BAC1_12380 [soil metagenome]